MRHTIASVMLGMLAAGVQGFSIRLSSRLPHRCGCKSFARSCSSAATSEVQQTQPDTDIKAAAVAPVRERGPNLKYPPVLPKDQWPTYPGFAYEILHKDAASEARTALLTTPNGVVETPAFIFCATKAAIKGLTMEQMKACGTQIVLSNTYHLLVSVKST
jgi:Queuine tRNA-ribosyltransferase